MGVYSNFYEEEEKVKMKGPDIETIRKWFPGKNENDVIKIINSLNDYKSEIMQLRLGLNGKSIHTINEIADIKGMTEERVLEIIKKTKEIIRKQLEALEFANKIVNSNGNDDSSVDKQVHIKEPEQPIEEEVFNTKNNPDIKTIKKWFPDYTFEEVLEAIKTLDDYRREIIELKLGLNCKKITSTKDIAILYGKDCLAMNGTIMNIKKAILCRLENLKLFGDMETIRGKRKKTLTGEVVVKKPTKNKKTVSLVKDKIGPDLETIKKWFPDYTFEEVLEAIKTLDDYKRELIELRLGLNGKKITSIKDISILYNVNLTIINNAILNTRKAILCRLKNFRLYGNMEVKRGRRKKSFPEVLVSGNIKKKECTPSLSNGIVLDKKGICKENPNKVKEDNFPSDFEKYRSNVLVLLNLLNLFNIIDSETKMMFMQRLGYYGGLCFSEEKTADYFGCEVEYVYMKLRNGIKRMKAYSDWISQVIQTLGIEIDPKSPAEVRKKFIHTALDWGGKRVE